MRTVYKYTLEVTGEQDITMPEGAIIRHVGVQDTEATVAAEPLSWVMENRPHEKLTVWAEVDTERRSVLRRFLVVGTGHPMTPAERWDFFLGTVIDGPLVWHVYDGGEVA